MSIPLLCPSVDLLAQSDFFIDSVAIASIEIPTSASLTTSKYFYNSDCKVVRIIDGDFETTYLYGDNFITQETINRNNSNDYLRRETIFNDSNQIVLFLKSRQLDLLTIDSFFYESNLQESIKYYEARSSGNHLLLRKESYSYNIAGPLESLNTTYYDQFTQDSIGFEHEEYTYDENMNILTEVKRMARKLGDVISYDSIFYSYTDDHEIHDKTQLLGDNAAQWIRYSSYSYKDSTTIIVNYNKEINQWHKKSRMEIQNSPTAYYEFDTLKIYEFTSENDSMINQMETNKLFYYASEDTLRHRNSKIEFEDLNIDLHSITKTFYVRYPEFLKQIREDLPRITVFPNPVSAGGIIELKNVKFAFDKVVIYPMNNGEMQILDAGRTERYFNAPRESGMYLVQLWNKNLPVTEVAKVIVQ
ncbi:hypothetical protein N9B82_02040 [Saprospiraceae bacterium]|nr:hypothetical protein [Saprospiraceae bacterium]